MFMYDDMVNYVCTVRGSNQFLRFLFILSYAECLRIIQSDKIYCQLIIDARIILTINTTTNK